MSRRANSYTTPFLPHHIETRLWLWPPLVIKEIAEFGGTAMPFVSLMRHPFIRIAVVTVSAIAAVPALAQSAAQWPERPLTPGNSRCWRRGRYVVAEPVERLPTIRQRAAIGCGEQARSGRHHCGGRCRAKKPDGYTLFLAEVGPNAVSHTLAELPYDPHTAFTPVIRAGDLPAAILIRPTLPHVTLSEFIAAAKQQPRKFNYASAGLGNWTHLLIAYLNSRPGIDQIDVTYRSGAEMLTSLLRNDADTAIITVSTALGQIKEGRIGHLPALRCGRCPNSRTPRQPGRRYPVLMSPFGTASWGPPAWILHWSPGSTASSTRLAGAGGSRGHHRSAGRRDRWWHPGAIRRLHQERAEALAGGRQGRWNNCAIAW